MTEKNLHNFKTYFNLKCFKICNTPHLFSTRYIGGIIKLSALCTKKIEASNKLLIQILSSLGITL